MAKIDIDVKLSQIKDAFLFDVEGRTAIKRCICIPLESLFVDKNRNIWLNLVGYDDTKFDKQTHTLKQKLSKAQYDELPVDPNTGKKALTPYCGLVKSTESRGEASSASELGATQPVDDGDLPF